MEPTFLHPQKTSTLTVVTQHHIYINKIKTMGNRKGEYWNFQMQMQMQMVETVSSIPKLRQHNLVSLRLNLKMIGLSIENVADLI